MSSSASAIPTIEASSQDGLEWSDFDERMSVFAPPLAQCHHRISVFDTLAVRTEAVYGCCCVEVNVVKAAANSSNDRRGAVRRPTTVDDAVMSSNATPVNDGVGRPAAPFPVVGVHVVPLLDRPSTRLLRVALDVERELKDHARRELNVLSPADMLRALPSFVELATDTARRLLSEHEVSLLNATSDSHDDGVTGDHHAAAGVGGEQEEEDEICLPSTATCGVVAATTAVGRVEAGFRLWGGDGRRRFANQRSLLDVPLGNMQLIALYLYRQKDLLALMSTCHTLHTHFTVDCEMLWRVLVKRRVKAMAIEPTKPFISPAVREDRVVNRVPWSARWAHAFLCIDKNAIATCHPLASLDPSCNEWKRWRQHEYARELYTTYPDDEERIRCRAWLTLFHETTNSVARKWARIQANYCAGNGHIALRLAAEFPYGSVGAKFARRLGIPQTAEAQEKFAQRALWRSLDTTSETDERDVTAGTEFSLLGVGENASRRSIRKPFGSGPVASTGALEDGVDVEPPAETSAGPTTPPPPSLWLAFARRAVLYLTHPAICHVHRIWWMRRLVSERVNEEDLPLPPGGAVHREDWNESYVHRRSDSNCARKYQCRPSALGDFGAVDMLGRLSHEGEKKLRTLQNRLLAEYDAIHPKPRVGRKIGRV